MQQQMYSIYDSVQEIYHQPHFMINEAAALRQFADMANDEQSNVNKHPTDYSLWHVGSYEDTTATIELLDTPKRLCYANEHVIQFTTNK